MELNTVSGFASGVELAGPGYFGDYHIYALVEYGHPQGVLP